jgi:Co/Zn/Cd efflux system component
LKQTGAVLLDREMDHDVVEEIRQAIEQPGDPDQARITDLHVWRVGKNAYSCAVGIVTHGQGVTPEWVRERLSVHEEIVHTTIEIQRYP